MEILCISCIANYVSRLFELMTYNVNLEELDVEDLLFMIGEDINNKRNRIHMVEAMAHI